MSTSPDPGRRLAAVWFADIVGYTTLSSQDEDGALEVVAAFQRIAEDVVTHHSGRVVKYIGDAALAEFASTDGAIRSALALMERFAADERVRPYGCLLRIGVNVGEVISSPDGDIYGDGVNLASRLQNQASPGQVIASEAVHAQIRQRTVFRTEPLGQRAMKGIADPVSLYAVTLQEAGGGAPIMAGHLAGGASPQAKPAGRRRRVLGAAGITVAVAAVLAVLDPGGVVTRLLAGGGAAVADATYPEVEGGMEVDGAIRVAFTGAVDAGTVNGENVRLLDPWGGTVAAAVAVSDDGRSAVVDPDAPLAYAARYRLEVLPGLLDVRGRSVGGGGGGEGPWRREIPTQPLPEGVEPATVRLGGDGTVAAAASVALDFSEPIDVRSAGAGAVRIVSAQGGDVEVSARAGTSPSELVLEPASPLAAGGGYAVRLGPGLRTARGVPVAPDSLPFRVVEGPPARAGSAEGALPPRPAPRRAATGPATLNLRAVPSAASAFLKVVVNGDTLGPPPVRGVSLEEGRRHTVVLVGVPDLSAYTLVVFRREVDAEPGQLLDLPAEITPFGSIDVVSQPAGTVFIDGRQAGRTPLAGYPVTAGVIHRLEIRPLPDNAGAYGPFTGEFRVEPLEWKSLGRLALPPRSGGQDGRP